MLYLMSKIYKKDILPFLDILLPILYTLSKENFKLVEDMLYYVLENAESKEGKEVLHFFEKAVSEEKRGNIMTIAEKLRAEGMQQGMQNKALEIAKKMVSQKIDINTVSTITGLNLEEIDNIKKSKQ